MNAHYERNGKKMNIRLEQCLVLAKKELKQKYQRTSIGFFWSFLMPILQTIVYYWVFKIVMRFDMPHYVLYLASGIFIWQSFSNMLMSSLFTYISNASLIKKSTCPRYIPVLSACLAEVVQFICSLPVIYVCMKCSSVPCTMTVLLLPVLILFLFLYGFGFSLVFAVSNLFFRDLERIALIIMQLWFFATPVFYPISSLPRKFEILLWMNPFYPLLTISRSVFYSPDAALPATVFPLLIVWSLLIVSTGWFCYQMNYKKFAELL